MAPRKKSNSDKALASKTDALPVKKLTFRDLAKAAGSESVQAYIAKAAGFEDVKSYLKSDLGDRGDDVLLCRVYGKIVRSRVARTQFGESVYFLGNFKATLADGRSFVSNKIFLPEYLATELEAGLQENKSELQFGYDIFLRPADTNIGYEFIGTSLMDRTSDPFGALEAAMPALIPVTFDE